VYDMYPWNESESGLSRQADDAPGPRRPGAEAVQFALDRRDNGGDATPAGRSATPAGRSATPPAASLTRQ